MPAGNHGCCIHQTMREIDPVTRIVAESRAWFDEYNYRDSLQARAIEGIGYYQEMNTKPQS